MFFLLVIVWDFVLSFSKFVGSRRWIEGGVFEEGEDGVVFFFL